MTSTPGAGPSPDGPARRAVPRDTAEAMAAVLRALADPLRLQIVSVVSTAPTGRVPAGQIASITELTPPTVSHHLRSLREAGVLDAHRRGTWVDYALAPGMDRVVSGLLGSLAAAAAAANAPVPTGAPGEGPGAALDSQAALGEIADRLVERFDEMDDGLVRSIVRESYTDLGRTARVSDRLPALAESFATQRLEDLDRARSAGPGRPPQVLFVCVANAGRSQLAAALLRKHAGDAVVVRSAGSTPAAEVHRTVRPLLAELDADHPGSPVYPKPLTDDAVRAADVVVTMGCGDTCPVLPGTRYEDWPVGDPALASEEGVRAIRDDLETRVLALVADLTDRHPVLAPTGADRPQENR